MENIDIKIKDFDLLVERLLIKNSAYLRTIIQTQMEILNRLSNLECESVELVTKKLQKENRDFILEYINNSFPQWWDMNPSMKKFK